MQDHLNLKTFLALLITVLFWASAFPVIRYALQYYSANHIVLLRFLSAAIFVIGIVFWQRIRFPKAADLPILFILGFIGFSIYNIALVNGERSVLSGAASMIVASSPVLTMLLSVFFWKEKIHILGWVGSGISLLGVALIAFRDLISFQLEPGALVIFMAAMCLSIYTAFQKKLHLSYSALQITIYTILCGTIPLLIYSRGVIQGIEAAPLSATLSIFYLGVFPTVISYLSWNYALSQISASRAANFQYLTPVFAVLIAWVWLAEVPGWLTLVGGLLTVLGLGIVNGWGKLRLQDHHR